ncbi:hypothetical protein GALMADRAFT_745166 [Galerina marginata CBS 339.88]|uniref:CHAT domain-containing protein n=1 Tax=Galerina marginata (strain CBS 339.88) TaxID=685588 RepID=A0A067T1Y3_GALM3|nr:hypothetical protein GALMADRAFT_745166 [Galerina marginata CBS 339.88]
MSDASGHDQPSADIVIKAQIRSRLASAVPQIPIIRPGEFCDAETFLDDLPAVCVDIISKISASEPSSYQSEFCSRRSESDLLLAVRSNSSIALDSSIALGSVAVKYLQTDDPNRGIVISMFGRALNRRWQVSKEDKHLDDTIYYFQKTIEIEPIEEPNRALHFDDLGCALWKRYTRHHHEDDFQASKTAFESAAGLPHSGKPMFLSNLGSLHRDKALSSSNEKDLLLEISLKIHLEAITVVTPEFLGSIRSLHRNLATTYMEIYPVDDADPVENIESAVNVKVRASGHRWAFLYELGVLFSNKFVTTGEQKDGNIAILFLRAALVESPENKTILATLSNTLERKGLSLRSQDVLAEAYQLSVKMLEMTSEHGPEIIERLLSTTVLANRQFDLSGDLKDIEKAISHTRRASSFLTDSQRWKFLQIIGVQLGYRFQITNNPNDLEESVLSLKTAVDTVGDLTNFDRATNLREYGKVLFARFRFRQNQEDFDGAVQSLQAAVELFGPDNSAIVSAINDLGNAMTVQFEKTGQLGDILKAIDYHLKALTALERFPLIKNEKSVYYVGLGNAFYIKYEMWDQAADLNQAITYYEECVRNTNPSDVQLGTRLGSLCRALLHKFRVTHERKLLDTVQENIKSFLERQPPPQPESIAYLQNILGHCYLHEYDESDNDIRFFDKAAESFQAALDSGCTLPLLVNPPAINLTKTLIGKYSKTTNDVDFFRALQQAVKMQMLVDNPGNQREMRGLFDVMAQFTAIIYDTKNLTNFGRMAIMAYGSIASDASAFSERRLWACLQSSRLIYEIDQASAKARDVLVQAIQYLPEAVLMGPNRGDQLRVAKELSALPGFLVSFSLAAGDPPADVLFLYEQSRSMIWNRLMDLKTDLSHLHDKHEELANKFEHLRVALHRASPQAGVTEESAIHRVRQHNLNNEYNETLRLIRQEKGFERFLLLDEPSHIVAHANQGPIVILNATKYRGDAIMVTSKGVLTITLPGFILENCIAEGARLHGALATFHIDPEHASLSFTKALKWLWEVAAKPVLDELGLTGGRMDDQSLPRIWWVVNGWISVLPIHAAGDHAFAKETGEPCTVMDRVISSYIPTIRALDYVRKSATDLSAVVKAHPNTAVLIKMPTTPDDEDLTNVSREVASVEDLLQPTFQVTTLDRPRRKDVMPVLEHASLAHFACHGIADDTDPSLSRLKLRDWKTNPLDVRFLLRGSFKRLRLVYLSACATALTKASELQGESIHPSAAFQMAGVPHTIASSWNIDDSMSVQIASDFYSYLCVEQGVFDFSKSAEALHSSTMKARNEGVDPLLWGAFIHSGA